MVSMIAPELSPTSTESSTTKQPFSGIIAHMKDTLRSLMPTSRSISYIYWEFRNTATPQPSPGDNLWYYRPHVGQVPWSHALHLDPPLMTSGIIAHIYWEFHNTPTFPWWRFLVLLPTCRRGSQTSHPSPGPTPDDHFLYYRPNVLGVPHHHNLPLVTTCGIIAHM